MKVEYNKAHDILLIRPITNEEVGILESFVGKTKAFANFEGLVIKKVKKND